MTDDECTVEVRRLCEAAGAYSVLTDTANWMHEVHEVLVPHIQTANPKYAAVIEEQAVVIFMAAKKLLV